MQTVRRIPLSHRFINARAARDFDEMMRLGQELLEKNPEDTVTSLALARYLTAIGQDEDSVPYWRILRAADPDHLEARFHLARILPLDASSSDIVDEDRTALLALETKSIPETGLPRPMHVAICGMAYCGSTLMECVLGSLPGASSIGESHWLSKHRSADGKNHELRLSDEMSRLFLIECTECGEGCQAISHADRLGLSADRRNWYLDIAQRLNTQLLISSDKNLLKLVDNDQLLRMHALVLFKSPRQSWRSWLKNLPEGQDAAFYLEKCQRFMDLWAKSYGAFLDIFNPDGRKVFLNFDEFTRNPEPCLETVCARLVIPYDVQALRQVRLGHAIGGNGKYVQRLRSNDYQVEIMQLPDAEFTPEQEALIENHTELQRVYGAMMELHDSAGCA